MRHYSESYRSPCSILQIFAVLYHIMEVIKPTTVNRRAKRRFFSIACPCPPPPSSLRFPPSLFVIVNRDLHNWSSPCCHLNLGKYTKIFQSSYIQLLSYVAYPEQSSVNCNLTFSELYFCNKIMAKVREDKIIIHL